VQARQRRCLTHTHKHLLLLLLLLTVALLLLLLLLLLRSQLDGQQIPLPPVLRRFSGAAASHNTLLLLVSAGQRFGQRQTVLLQMYCSYLQIWQQLNWGQQRRATKQLLLLGC
jgi:hypothetical protein